MKKLIAAGLILVALIFVGIACYSYAEKENKGDQMMQDFHRAFYDDRWVKQFPIERLYRGE
ncbi:hypothetical protein [Paenilisteria rocourtiae]|uniref:Uncharacterized protein n=1 Tax=Listeria rocourtiae TaxID=647910 RepID=A0A4R6ZKZ5_9LIST|nr:hypothetical protein [Listeria rocourtiae]EUJ42500.1 hypothetical protein PROCOU_17094 [Listeria rocourtiae FSL F6-920]MBC1435317.1 hypothetical protein [Listeria rocourtiae]MBC1604359.1 hypothetical protein [Listeria rocourtiae]TDR52922.1 hypothetical protein DFP96_106129 [Listeria rocourtiae]